LEGSSCMVVVNVYWKLKGVGGKQGKSRKIVCYMILLPFYQLLHLLLLSLIYDDD